jgi:acyl dehydratase
MRMLCDAWLGDSASLGSPGIEKLDWLRPVRPGDTLRVRQTVLDATPSRSRPAMGAVRFRFEVLNGADEPVLRQENPILFERREPGQARAENSAPGRAEPRASRPKPPMPAGDPSPVGPPVLFDDLIIGRTEILGRQTLTREAVLAFARDFDPQRFHLSEEAAARTHFGRLSASGWQTAALWMRSLVERRAAALRHRATQADQETSSPYGPSPGFKDLRWLKPVYPGDTLTFATTLTDMRASASRPGWGLMFNHNAGWNQDGELVIDFLSSGFIARAAAR